MCSWLFNRENNKDVVNYRSINKIMGCGTETYN